jgi:hypothetical protein
VPFEDDKLKRARLDFSPYRVGVVGLDVVLANGVTIAGDIPLTECVTATGVPR